MFDRSELQRGKRLEEQALEFLSEPELLRRVQGGDESAFEQLYRKHIGRVYALCLRITADVGRAEVLAQDVFVRVWETVRSFRGESAFSTWLHRVTVNVVLVDRRNEQRRKQRVATTDDLERYDSADRTIPSGGMGMDIEKAIAALPKQARAVLVLHDVEGYQHNEIASMMDIAVGTSKAQLHRARKLLRGALER